MAIEYMTQAGLDKLKKDLASIPYQFRRNGDHAIVPG